jgi:hypothetical protein
MFDFEHAPRKSRHHLERLVGSDIGGAAKGNSVIEGEAQPVGTAPGAPLIPTGDAGADRPVAEQAGKRGQLGRNAKRVGCRRVAGRRRDQPAQQLGGRAQPQLAANAPPRPFVLEKALAGEPGRLLGVSGGGILADSQVM